LYLNVQKKYLENKKISLLTWILQLNHLYTCQGLIKLDDELYHHYS